MKMNKIKAGLGSEIHSSVGLGLVSSLRDSCVKGKGNGLDTRRHKAKTHQPKESHVPAVRSEASFTPN